MHIVVPLVVRVVSFVVVRGLPNFCYFSCGSLCCCSCYRSYVVVSVVGDIIVQVVVMFVNVVVDVVVNVFKVAGHVVVIVWIVGKICQLAGAHKEFFVVWPSSSISRCVRNCKGHFRCKKKLDDAFCFNQTPPCFRSVWCFFFFYWSGQILSKTKLQTKTLYIV